MIILYKLSQTNFGQFILRFSHVLQSNKGASSLTMRLSSINFNQKDKLSMENIDIISIITGSLLGCGQAKKRINGSGTRVSFFQQAKHVNYLL